jgi:hypothetical protein
VQTSLQFGWLQDAAFRDVEICCMVQLY